MKLIFTLHIFKNKMNEKTTILDSIVNACPQCQYQKLVDDGRPYDFNEDYDKYNMYIYDNIEKKNNLVPELEKCVESGSKKIIEMIKATIKMYYEKYVNKETNSINLWDFVSLMTEYNNYLTYKTENKITVYGMEKYEKNSENTETYENTIFQIPKHMICEGDYKKGITAFCFNRTVWHGDEIWFHTWCPAGQNGCITKMADRVTDVVIYNLCEYFDNVNIVMPNSENRTIKKINTHFNDGELYTEISIL